MKKNIYSILVCLLLVTVSITTSVIAKEDYAKDLFLSKSEAPDDFYLDAYCGGCSLWEDLYRVQIDNEGNGVYSISTPDQREYGEYTEITQFNLDQNELDELWNEILINEFFDLNEMYAIDDLYPGTDIEISGGTFSNIMIIGNGAEHMVETRHVCIPDFNNVMIAINSVTPGDNDLFYNGLFNIPPFSPDRPSGPTSGNYQDEHTYSTSAIDLDNDDLYFKFDWGDGQTSDWFGPYESGETAIEKHKWNSKGDYIVRIKTIDDPNGDGDISDGIESSWSEPLPVSMPRAKSNFHLFKSLLVNFRFILLRFANLLNIFRDNTPKISIIERFPPATEITLDEEKCEIKITIRIKIWGAGASDTLASSMVTQIENLLNKDKNEKPWKFKCPKDECKKEDPGCSVEFDIIIINAGPMNPGNGEGYHVFYVAPKQGSTLTNTGGKRFVSFTMTADANKKDNIVDWPRPNDKTSNLPPPPRNPIIENGSTVGCLHADDIVGTWAHEFLHCMGLDDKYEENWTDADQDGYRDAGEVKVKPKPGHEDDIMANATKWLQQSAINLTMERIGLKCPCKCCPDDNDTTPPETKIESPGGGQTVSSPLIVGGYADDGPGGSGIVLIDYFLEWDGGDFDGEDYLIDPPEQLVQFDIGPLELGSFIDEGDWISITVYATDDAGNTGYDNVTVIWDEGGDTTPPVTEKTIGEPNEEEGYIIWPFTPITFDATDDDSGVEYIYYEVWWDSDGNEEVDTLMGSEYVYDITITFSVDMWGVPAGIIELRWFAEDNAGNAEDMHFQEHYVMP